MSLLVHQLFLTVVGEVWKIPEVVPPEPQEIVLVEAPPNPPAPEPPVPEVKPPPMVMPKPKAAPTSRPMVKRPPEPVAPIPETTPPEPPSEAVAVPSAGPEPPAPEKTVNLDLNWNNFEHAFAKQAETEREAYVEQSLERRRGSGRYGKMTAKVRRALQTNRGWARPGNQEPLGDRQRIFHAYVDRVHQNNIHPLFGESFWGSLSSFAPNHPLNDWSLQVVTEFEIFSTGRISEVRVVRTSGNTVFDAAAVDSIYRSSPFPTPPKAILSWNDRVYLRWGFYRNRRMCGVFNVEPFILAAPNEKKEQISIEEFIKDDG